MKGPVLLLSGLEESQARKVRLTAMRFAIRVRDVAPAELGAPLSALCGLTETPADLPAAPAPLADPVLVMCLFPAGLAEKLLAALRREKLAKDALKAVLTPSNAAWSLAQLHGELCRERAAFASGATPVHPSPAE